MRIFYLFLKKILSPEIRSYIKKKKRHIINYFKNTKVTDIALFKDILINTLGLKKGDRIIVSSSYGNLNVNFSPEELIKLLQSIVTEEGLIIMPYYPPMNSYEWADSDNIFDMNSTKSGMGILTNIFSKMPGVLKSKHPTKAVCAWGNEAAELIAFHENSTTPFYWDSPYGKLLIRPSKSLCLGVKNLPIFHSLEDIFSKEKDAYYLKGKKTLKLKQNNKIEFINTYIHDPDILHKTIYAFDYIKEIDSKAFKKYMIGYKYILLVDNDILKEEVKKEFDKGHTRIKK